MLADGILQVGDWIDVCNADFEVSIGVALAVATIAAMKGAAIAWMAATLAMIDASVGWGESVTLYVDGVLQNKGPANELVYMRISRLKYKVDPLRWCFWCSPCYYDVPVAMFFRMH